VLALSIQPVISTPYPALLWMITFNSDSESPKKHARLFLALIIELDKGIVTLHALFIFCFGGIGGVLVY
jgi:hypothetical protein